MKAFCGSMLAVFCMVALATGGRAQETNGTGPLPFARAQGTAAPPAVITLQDALDAARKIDPAVQAAVFDEDFATEDTLQVRAARRPTVEASSAYLNTQGNGQTPNGRFVANDGVHVYRSVATVRQEISANTFLKTDSQRAAAALVLTAAKTEVARRGLDVTVTERYYTLVAAQRRYAAAQQGVQQAERFVALTQQLEQAGEAAHSDVIKAQLQVQRQQQGLQDATLAMENSRLGLTVLISSSLNENFTVVDDLDSAQTLPTFAEIQTLAEMRNPELKAAGAAIRVASMDVRAARNAVFPTLSVEANYGLEANAFKLHSTPAADPSVGPLPNLGYTLGFNLSIPVFNWGSTRSKVRQAEIREKQAGVELNRTQRELLGNLYTTYNEAVAARASVDLTRSGGDLAAESLRLTNLRYQAGEATVLEVVDAQDALLESRTAHDEAQVRYRIAVSSLQGLSGGF